MAYDLTVFKDNDIRGSGRSLTSALMKDVGRALADFLDDGPVAVGRDMRNDSARVADALIAGLKEQGRLVWDIGMVPSEVIYFAVGHFQLAGGAMVTASHNPGEDDGIKLVREDAKPVGIESGLLDIKLAIRDRHFKAPKKTGEVEPHGIIGEWVRHAVSFIEPEKIKPMKLAIDAGNGMAGVVIPHVLPYLPQLKVEEMYFEPDGNFPHHPADPHNISNLADLIKRIKHDKLDCGLAFDGDGDRAFLVDEKGQPVSSSELMVLLSRFMLKRHPGSIVMYNLMMSRTVPEAIKAAGGRPIRTKVGGSYIKADMRQYNALFAGEHSGHFYFRDNYFSDSGLIAALVGLQVLSDSGKTLSQLVTPYKRYFDQQEISRKIDDIGEVVELLIQHYKDGQIDLLDGLTVDYKDWWFNIRLSHTEPVIRLNVEANKPDLLQEKTFEVLNIIRSFH